MTATALRLREPVSPPQRTPAHSSSTDRRVPRGIVSWSRAWTVIGLALWLMSLPSLRSAHVTTYGLLFAGSPLFPVATVSTVIAFGLAVRRAAFADAVLALLAFIAVVRVTVSVITPMPIYTWTYKHLGVISYIQTTGHVAHNADIYMSWPGGFTAIAWFSALSGISTLALAQWFAVGIHVFIAAGVYSLCRAFGQSTNVAITGAFIAEIVNWVGQDYLSPQAIGFVLATAVLTLLINSNRSVACGYLSLPILLAVTVTHQLTPFWLTGLAVVLGVFKAVRPRWIGLAYAAITLGYLAVNFSVVAQYGLLGGFNPFANAQSNVTTVGSAGHDFTSLMVKIPSLLLWGTAAVAVAVIIRRRRAVRAGRSSRPMPPSPLAPGLMAFSSFGLLAGQSYGGEAIFRVFLYSIPGCVLLTAPVVAGALTWRSRSDSRSRRILAGVVPIAAFALVTAIAMTSLQGYYGGWFTNLVRRDSYNEAVHLLRTAPANSVILSLDTGIPERPIGRYVDFVRHEKFYDAEIDLVPGITGAAIAHADVLKNLEQVIGPVSGPIYLVITTQMLDYSTYYGVYPTAALATFRATLAYGGNWTTLSSTPTMKVYRYIGKR